MKVGIPALETSPPESRPNCAEPRRCARVTVFPAAIAANWGTIARFAGPGRTGAAIKADAYGHGLREAASVLARAGCCDFFVASLAEGVIARKAMGPGPRLWVLNGLAGARPDALRAACLNPVLNGLEDVALWAGAGDWALHLDTGMNRLGLPMADWAEAAAITQACPPGLVMSHLACADQRNAPMNGLQLQRFVEGAVRFPRAMRSLVASAGLGLGQAFHLDLVRPGLALYGHWGTDQAMAPLVPAMQAHAPILQIRKVQTGESIGYGASYRCTKPAILAIIGIGYADGFLRSMSNRGYGALDGVLCPVRGRVSMDLTTLDVTAAGTRAQLGAMVEMLGSHLSAAELALLSETIPYEVMTSLGMAAASADGRIMA